MVLLAQHLRLEQNMTKEQILESVIRGQLENISLLNQSSCARNQIKPDMLNETFPKLVALVDKKDLLGQKDILTEEDMTGGFEIFHAIVFCPSSLSMDFKLFHFVDTLISNESPRTIIKSFVSLFRSGVAKEVGRMASMNKFYDVLATKFNLKYGNVLLATSKKSDLQTMIDNDWPFFTNHTDLVKHCLSSLECNDTKEIIQTLGAVRIIKCKL